VTIFVHHDAGHDHGVATGIEDNRLLPLWRLVRRVVVDRRPVETTKVDIRFSSITPGLVLLRVT
jgi:hypothetical protein